MSVTTYMPRLVGAGHSQPIILPYLHPRELEDATDALNDGRFVAVAVPASVSPPTDGEIVALVSPEYAERFVAGIGGEDVVADLRDELRGANKELQTLREIVREAMAEKDPTSRAERIDAAIVDVVECVDRALDHTEDL